MMDDSDIAQQMTNRERFAPDADEIRAAVTASRSGHVTARNDRRRPRMMALAAASAVIVIALAVGVVTFLRPAQRMSSLPSAPMNGTTSSAVPAWADIRWSLTMVSKQGVTEDAASFGPAFLNFAIDGSVTGSASCYNLSGSWISDGRTAEIAPLKSRDHSCAPDLSPSHRVITEAALRSLITVGATRGHVVGQSLIIESGPYELTYRNAGPMVSALSSTQPPSVTGSASPVVSMSLPPVQNTTPATILQPPAARQQIVSASVYDPMGDGVTDNADLAPLAFDGDLSTFWHTFVYKQQFPSVLKPGVGLTVRFSGPITPTAVTVLSDSPGTVIEIRSAAGQDVPYSQTTALGRGTITAGPTGGPGTVRISVAGAPRSQYLVVFVVHLSAHGSNFESDINEISVLGR